MFMPDSDCWESSLVWSFSLLRDAGVKTDEGSEGLEGTKCLVSGWKICLGQGMGRNRGVGTSGILATELRWNRSQALGLVLSQHRIFVCDCERDWSCVCLWRTTSSRACLQMFTNLVPSKTVMLGNTGRVGGWVDDPVSFPQAISLHAHLSYCSSFVFYCLWLFHHFFGPFSCQR